jgi:hypothetical protein
MSILRNSFDLLFLLGTGITAVSASELSAVATADPNKWQYNLYNPTPRVLMREMSTDRPDKTESPYTGAATRSKSEFSAPGKHLSPHSLTMAPRQTGGRGDR